MSEGRLARIERVEREDFPQDKLDVYDHVMKSRGMDKMPNVFALLANSPGALETVCAVGEHVRFKTDFDAVLRELVIMTVAQEIRCEYEWTHHWRVAADAGAEEAQLLKIGTPALEAEPMPVGPTVKYARLVANNEPVDDDLFATIHDHFGEAGFVDLTIMVAYYAALGRFLNVIAIQVEDGYPEFGFNK